MGWKMSLAPFAALACAFATQASAQEGQKYLTLSYHARETINLRDNDILRLTYDIEDPGFAGLSRLTMFGGFRDVGINLGASSRDASLDKADLGLETLWLRDHDAGRRGFGVRFDYAETYHMSYELAGIYERFGNAFDLRLVGGLQGVTDDVPNRDDFSPYAVAEATWWVRDHFLLRAGLQGDSDGALFTTGFEVGIKRTPASFYLDFGIAIDGYRHIDEYNDVSGGIRFALGGGRKSLKQIMREGTLRSFHRTIEVQ